MRQPSSGHYYIGMRAALPAMILLLLGAAYPGFAQELSLGASSGFFVAPNPGSAYATPLSTSLTARAYFDLRTPIHADAAVTLLPFVPLDSDTDSSFMAVFESGVGSAARLLEFRDGEVRIGGVFGAGGYARSVGGSEDGEVARRPLAFLAPYALLSLFSWEYQLSLRYRLLFDLEVVHTLEPAVTVSYRFGPSRGDR